MSWLLIVLAMAGAVTYGVWDYRRKSAAREAASKARFEKMFKGKAAAAPVPDTPLAPSTAAASPVPQASAPVAAVPADRFLDPAGKLTFLLLKGSLPDHEVFAKVMLASVVSAAASGHQREQDLRRLSQYQVDFVICDRDMRVVAVVENEAAGGADAVGVRHFKAECLKAAGIRLVQLNAAARPRREEIRAQVLGNPRQ